MAVTNAMSELSRQLAGELAVPHSSRPSPTHRRLRVWPASWLAASLRACIGHTVAQRVKMEGAPRKGHEERSWTLQAWHRASKDMLCAACSLAPKGSSNRGLVVIRRARRLTRYPLGRFLGRSQTRSRVPPAQPRDVGSGQLASCTGARIARAERPTRGRRTTTRWLPQHTSLSVPMVPEVPSPKVFTYATPPAASPNPAPGQQAQGGAGW